MNRTGVPVIVFAGRFNSSEELSGPEKAAKRIFTEHSMHSNAVFIQYFFDGRKYGIMKKLFGKESDKQSETATVMTLGLFRIYKVLKSLNPGIIHLINFERFAIMIYLYTMFRKTKVIYNVHGAVSYENYELKKVPFLQKMKDRFCEKMFLKRSDKLVFNSVSAIDLSEKYFRFSEIKAVILPNGIDKEFRVAHSSSKRSAPLRAVFMYKNELGKTGLDFLNSFLEISETEFELYIISGKAPGIISRKNIKFTVVPQMTTAELALFYSDKDIFLSLNQYDTFSISTAEAMASGLIPVVTSQTGVSRYIESGSSGFVIEYGDTKALDDTIKTINSFPESKTGLIRKNAGAIYESLSWEKVHDMYLELYKETAA